tara:strand:+ start:1587 stop:2501 length:915 start_codon:yes stop_codon:yes gene_type:complete
MKKILGINISHNCSFAFFKNGILKEYYEEDRFNKIKRFEPPKPFIKKPYDYKVLKKFKNIKFDAVIIASYCREDFLIDKAYVDNILRQVKYKQAKFFYREHHKFHAVSGFYFSKFTKALCIVMDGGGERIIENYPEFQTVESIWEIDNKKIKTYYKHLSNKKTEFFDNPRYREKNIKKEFDVKISNKLVAGKKYTNYLFKAGFKPGEEGQLMGAAAYNDGLNKKILNIAKKAQHENLKESIKLIKKTMTYSDCKNIILSGGCYLNCSNNFKLVKHFPNLNFFVDPIPYDGGTAVGAAYFYENYL